MSLAVAVVAEFGDAAIKDSDAPPLDGKDFNDVFSEEDVDFKVLRQNAIFVGESPRRETRDLSHYY